VNFSCRRPLPRTDRHDVDAGVTPNDSTPTPCTAASLTSPR
jgi:hypothetical protein